MNFFKINVKKTCVYEGIIVANSIEEALIKKDRYTNDTLRIRTDQPESVAIESNITEFKGDIVANDVFKLLNNEHCIVIKMSQKDNFPFLCSMYDPCDPNHTRGDTDYFIDQLTDMITNENKVEVMKEIKYIFQYDEVIVMD